MLFSNETGTLVYFFCPDCQTEEVHPVYAFNVDYFRMVRDIVVEKASEKGVCPIASIPQARVETKTFVDGESLAEHLFNAEVADEQET
jgi:hypothetical protein